MLANGKGWCVSKSVLLAALCRASGIPCRLGYANVRNHMATRKLLDFLGTNIFYLILVLWFFKRMFARVKNKGMLMKLD